MKEKITIFCEPKKSCQKMTAFYNYEILFKLNSTQERVLVSSLLLLLPDLFQVP